MEFAHKEQNGILKYLYSKNQRYFNNSLLFSYEYSNHHSTYLPFYAFDFGSSYYWVDNINYNIGDVNYISFCFKAHLVELIGYEIKTSAGNARPHKWTFSGSNDNKVWYQKKEATHFMVKDETHYEEWSGGIYRCFRFDFVLNAANTSIHSDIKQIELFGILYNLNNCASLKRKTKRNIVPNIMFINLVLS